MGLFDSKSDKEFAEREARSKLEKCPLPDEIVALLKNEEGMWPTICTGYYDSGHRFILIGEDMFSLGMKTVNVLFSDECQVRTESSDYKRLTVSYTDLEYLPLHEYKASNGIIVNLDRILYLWSQILLERLKSAFPACKFSSAVAHGSGYMITYGAQRLVYEDWF